MSTCILSPKSNRCCTSFLRLHICVNLTQNLIYCLFLSDSRICRLSVVRISFYSISHINNFLRIQFCILCWSLMSWVAALFINIIRSRLFMRICTTRALLLLNCIHSLLTFSSSAILRTKRQEISPSMLYSMHLGIWALHRLLSFHID